MKKILITGKGSYIGDSIEQWLMKPEFLGRYRVHVMDMQDSRWRESDFSSYDTVIHVAGIVHQRENKKNEGLYYQINRDLAVEVARKAKAAGAGQFVFFSTMSVYGKTEGVITEYTIPAPATLYGKSKLMAEDAILKLKETNFRIAILRPPMIYGKGCKGNYARFSRFVRRCPFFPYTTNQRSMLYIDNLSEFIRNVVEARKDGVFYPQNKEYVNVTAMAQEIAKAHGHQLLAIKGLASLMMWLCGRSAKKILGTLLYNIEQDRCEVVSFEESIRKTES